MRTVIHYVIKSGTKYLTYGGGYSSNIDKAGFFSLSGYLVGKQKFVKVHVETVIKEEK